MGAQAVIAISAQNYCGTNLQRIEYSDILTHVCASRFASESVNSSRILTISCLCSQHLLSLINTFHCSSRGRLRGLITTSSSPKSCKIERSTVGDVGQADIPVTDEFGCRVVYINQTRNVIESVETKLDSKVDNAVVSR